MSAGSLPALKSNCSGWAVTWEEEACLAAGLIGRPAAWASEVARSPPPLELPLSPNGFRISSMPTSSVPDFPSFSSPVLHAGIVPAPGSTWFGPDSAKVVARDPGALDLASSSWLCSLPWELP